ncbi:MAG: ribosome biogenesis GTP-binding protein YihA/YsxC [Parachlamydia sp.]|nr:ribosome biogenesis GTP-binding protein YihA/YsxC [Parachlamydia sp.]
MFKGAKFIKTAVQPRDYPTLRKDSGDLLPEIAVAGRSNVGKSSLINHLLQVKGLAKTSSTPGKTQAINFFTTEDALVIVDLPGYGFAQVPLEVRKRWGPMVQSYLENRETLKALLLLFDIRRLPNEEDLKLLEWANYNSKPIILVLTKVDKVKRNEQQLQTKKILEAFQADLPYVHYSSTKNIGRLALIHKVKEVL